MFECLTIGSSTIRRFSLIGEGMASLWEICHCGGKALRSYIPKGYSLLLLPVDPDLELRLQHVAMFPAMKLPEL